MGTLLVRRYEDDCSPSLSTSNTLEPPSKIPPVLPNYDEPLDDEEAEGLDEQNLDGFDTKVAAVDRHAQLNELANWLGDLYGERPVIPKWANGRKKLSKLLPLMTVSTRKFLPAHYDQQAVNTVEPSDAASSQESSCEAVLL